MTTRPTNDATDRRWSRLLGWLIVLAGLLSNPWSIGRLLAPDERIEDPRSIGLVFFAQAAMIVAGLWWIRRSGRTAPHRRWTMPLAALALAGVAVTGYGTSWALGIVDPHRVARSAWTRVDESEERILLLEQRLRELDRSALELALPDDPRRDLFADEVEVVGSNPEAATSASLLSLAVEEQHIPSSTRGTNVARADLRLWPAVFDQVRYWQHVRFKAVRGRPAADGDLGFETDVHFTGLARGTDGGWLSVDIDLTITWDRVGPAEEASSWRISGWRETGRRLARRASLMFEDIAPSSMADVGSRDRIAREPLDDLLRRYYQEPEAVTEELPLFMAPSVDQHPGLAVVDVDGDGWDDLYWTERWSPARLLRNRADGTFEEVSEALGLAVEDHATSAIFADFDNDGDQDAFVGRSLGPSRYFRNEGDARHPRFVDRTSSHVAGLSPCLVSSLSAADIDGDGLLDLYAATYGVSFEARLFFHPSHPAHAELRACISDADLEAWMSSTGAPGAHPVLDHGGPPNVVLHNRGDGRFAVLDDAVARELRLRQSTFQATWTDYDADGDADLYLANDFAPNHLLRNDRERGEAFRFTDVTAATGTTDAGFGMGASWGDYDADGRLDLYVSNMFTKAGQRILGQLDGLDPRLVEMTKGNTLLRQVGERFEMVSGPAPNLEVAKAGWSWGGQIVDLDNDAQPDVYVPNGFHTVPDEFALPVDL